MIRLDFPGITEFIEAAAKSNGKPHARNRIDNLRPLKDCGDLAGQIASRVAQLGEADQPVLESLAIIDERVNDLAIALAAATAIREHVANGLGIKSPAKPVKR